MRRGPIPKTHVRIKSSHYPVPQSRVEPAARAAVGGVSNRARTAACSAADIRSTFHAATDPVGNRNLRRLADGPTTIRWGDQGKRTILRVPLCGVQCLGRRQARHPQVGAFQPHTGGTATPCVTPIPIDAMALHSARGTARPRAP